MADEGYIVDPIEVDQDAIEQSGYEVIQSRFPDWKPADANLETWNIEANASMTAEAMLVASDVPPSIFKYFGSSLAGVAVIQATPATVLTTWHLTVPAATAITIAAGSIISIPGPDDLPVFFETVLPINYAVGEQTKTNIQVRAQEEGVDGNALGSTSFVASLVDVDARIDTVTLQSATSGGADEETDKEYNDKLSDRLTLQAPRPILAADYGLLARDLARSQGVEVRALAVDGYNPADGTTDNERMVAVTMVDAVTNADVDPTILAYVTAQLEAYREINFIVNAVDPNRVTVDVEYAVIARKGFDVLDAIADCNVALQEWFDKWGNPGGPESTAWEPLDTVRRQELSFVINAQQSVDYYTALSIRIPPAAFAATDIVIPGTNPLTLVVAGTIHGSAG